MSADTKGQYIHMRINAAEKESIRVAALVYGLTLSEFVRAACLAATHETMAQHPHTVASIRSLVERRVKIHDAIAAAGRSVREATSDPTSEEAA